MFEFFKRTTKLKKRAPYKNFTRKSKNLRFYTSTHQIPKLPVIDEIVEKTLLKKGLFNDIENTAIIGVQHMLETTATIFKGLIDIGINPKNMYFIGKCYSTSPIVEKEIIDLGINVFPSEPPRKVGQYHETCINSIEKMWEFYLQKSKEEQGSKVKKLIILDEGSRCLETMPREIVYDYKIAGIEQTRGGLYSELLNTFCFPLIDVASSVVKKQIEPPLIAEAVQKEVAKIIKNIKFKGKPIFGVVGNGAIGTAIAKYLLSQGCVVNVYDEDKNAFKSLSGLKYHECQDIKTLIVRSDYVFGCTGKDIIRNIDIFNILRKDTFFISCTSEDKEFLSALKEIGKIERIWLDPLADIFCVTNTGHKITFLKGGFPVNFNKEPWNVPANDIEVTQGLLLGSCIQAILTASNLTNKLSLRKLDPYLQQFVLNHWIYRQPLGRYADEHIEKFTSIDWINENSGGNYIESEFMKNTFSVENAYVSIPSLKR